MTSAALWIGFNVAVLIVLAIDLGLARGGHAPVSAKAATRWTLTWIVLSLAFCGAIWGLGETGTWPWGGRDRALEFVTAYLLEYALSVDNLFVFLVVFAYFKVTPQVQHKLLFWGVITAFILRAAFIVVGSELVHKFHWLLYVFGAFLVYTAIKLLVTKEDDEVDPEHNVVLKWGRRFLPIAKGDHGAAFVAMEDGKRRFTHLFLVLLVVETTDLLFALDSIPAVIGISKNPFIIYSSNVCAVLGLRSLFFLVSSLMGKFHYLKIGLGVVLAFVGLKMIGSRFYEVPVPLSLAIIAGILGFTIVLSILRPPKEEPVPKPPES